jgi:hypothetical protein
LAFSQQPEKLDASGVWHLEIGDHDIEARVLRQSQREGTAVRKLDRPGRPDSAQRASQAASHGTFIVYDENPNFRRGGVRAAGGFQRHHAAPPLQAPDRREAKKSPDLKQSFRWFRASRGGSSASASRQLALAGQLAIVPAQMEPGLVTLAKIVGTLLAAIGIVPLLFLMAPGDKSEPTDRLDSEQKL